MHRTKTDAALEQSELAHADDPERADVLHRARRFKASWIELAEALVAVKRGGRWKAWGYESLEAYAKTELRLRSDTVEKLTGSYTFLQRRAPAVLSRDGIRESLPSYQAVDFLRRAEATDADPDAIGEIRRRVLEDAAPAASVAREYGSVVFPLDDDARKERDVAGIKNVARRLRELLTDTRAVPRKVATGVRGALDELLETIDRQERHETAA